MAQIKNQVQITSNIILKSDVTNNKMYTVHKQRNKRKATAYPSILLRAIFPSQFDFLLPKAFPFPAGLRPNAGSITLFSGGLRGLLLLVFTYKSTNYKIKKPCEVSQLINCFNYAVDEPSHQKIDLIRHSHVLILTDQLGAK
uniref:Uncharacterized protein n=1 Tax=Anguilla anguilla TaxID=7936 RepID=A0A0E9WMZ8_ANGAN